MWVPWVPRPNDRLLDYPGRAWMLEVVGRLKDGVSLEQARARMGQIHATLQTQYPTFLNERAIITTSLADALIGSVRPWMLLLLTAVGVLLLITVRERRQSAARAFDRASARWRDPYRARRDTRAPRSRDALRERGALDGRDDGGRAHRHLGRRARQGQPPCRHSARDGDCDRPARAPDRRRRRHRDDDADWSSCRRFALRAAISRRSLARPHARKPVPPRAGAPRSL